MSYQPYVTGGTSGGGSGGNNNQNTYNSSTSATGTSNNYGYAPAPANAYGSAAPAASSYGTPASSYGTPTNNAYSSITSNTGSGGNTYSNPSSTASYGNTMPDFSQALNVPPPVQSTTPTTNSYGTSNYGSSTNTYSSGYTQPSSVGIRNTASNPPATNPGYSQAVATPVNNTGGYGNASTIGEEPSKYSSTTQVSGNVAVSALNSTTYSGGPTAGLISEGNPTICHKVDYEIKGHEMQLVEIELDPQETVIAEAGAMMFLDEGIDFKAKFGDGSTPKEGFFKKLMKAGGRLLMGESLFITHFTNQGGSKARVAFAAPYPGNILPMNLQDLNGTLICQKDAFLCAAKGTKLSIHFNKKIGSGLFGGEGFILQKLKGDGMAFVHAGGTVIRRELRGEKLRIDTGCVVAFTDGIAFDVQFVPGLKSMIFGGEGLFLATLQGTGTVWMQSLPFSRLADRVIQNAPSAGGRRKGEGSALTGGFGDLVNGDGFGFKL